MTTTPNMPVVVDIATGMGKVESIMTRVIVFVDIVRSVDHKVEHGDAEASRMITQRLQDIESTMRNADPTVQRISGAGDEIMLFAENPIIIFHSAVTLQARWMAWPHGRAAKISLGMGAFEKSIDGDYRGGSIDLTRRIMDVCPEGGVVVTEAIRAAVQAAGLASKLIRLEAHFKGFPGLESYYESDGKYVIPKDSRQPATHKPTVIVSAVDDNIPDTANVPSQAIEIPPEEITKGPIIPVAVITTEHPKKLDFWQWFAIAGLIALVGLMAFVGVLVYLTKMNNT